MRVSVLSSLAWHRYLRSVVVLQVLGSFMAMMAALIASSRAPPASNTLSPVRFSYGTDRRTRVLHLGSSEDRGLLTDQMTDSSHSTSVSQPPKTWMMAQHGDHGAGCLPGRFRWRPSQ